MASWGGATFMATVLLVALLPAIPGAQAQELRCSELCLSIHSCRSCGSNQACTDSCLKDRDACISRCKLGCVVINPVTGLLNCSVSCATDAAGCAAKCAAYGPGGAQSCAARCNGGTDSCISTCKKGCTTV